MAKLPKTLTRFLLEAVAGPALNVIGAKVGEAIGDVLGYHINPPDPDDEETKPKAEFNFTKD